MTTLRLGKPNSAKVAKHMLDNDHLCSVDNFKILQKNLKFLKPVKIRKDLMKDQI